MNFIFGMVTAWLIFGIFSIFMSLKFDKKYSDAIINYILVLLYFPIVIFLSFIKKIIKKMLDKLKKSMI